MAENSIALGRNLFHGRAAGVGLANVAFRKPCKRGVGIVLCETSVSEAPDRGAQRIDGAGSTSNQSVDQNVIEMPQDEPLRTTRRTDERIEKFRMESFGS